MNIHTNFPDQYDASEAQIIEQLRARVAQLKQEQDALLALVAKKERLAAELRLNQKRRSKKTASQQQEFQFIFNEAEKRSSVVPPEIQ